MPLEDIVKYEEELLVAIVRHDLYWVWWRRSSFIVEGTKGVSMFQWRRSFWVITGSFFSHPALLKDAIFRPRKMVAHLPKGPE